MSNGAYLDDGEDGILLPLKYCAIDLKVDDYIDVFLYRDNEGRMIATTLSPLGQVGDIVALKVMETTPFGVFLDWGVEKHLLLPARETVGFPQEGDLCVVKILIDKKSDRLVGHMKFDKKLNKDTSKFSLNQKVNMMPYRKTDLGYNAIVDGEYVGLLFKNELKVEPEIGVSIEGYIKNIRDDGKLDLSLQGQGYDNIILNEPEILDKLRANNGFLPYNDASPAEDIWEAFHISKKSFKKIIGKLYRERKIVFEDDGIKLIK